MVVCYILNVSILPSVSSGITPVSPDTERPRNSNDESPLKVDGIVPERSLDERPRNVNLDNCPSVFGIVPMKSFCDRLKNVRFFISPIVVGIVPVNAFSDKTKCWRLVNSPIATGKAPVTLVFQKSSRVKVDARLPKVIVGNVPVIYVSPQPSIDRLLSDVEYMKLSHGNVPVM